MPLPLPRRPDVVDVRICVASLLSGLALWALGLHMQQDRPLGHAWSLLPLFAMAGLELTRRTAPRPALIAGAFVLIADQFTTGNLATVVMFTDLVYAAVVYGTPAEARRIPVTTGLITVAVTVGFLAWFRDPEAILVGAVIALVAFTPATTGVLVRNHREAADMARLRAEQTALLAEVDRAQAVTAERARMARELHDMVANHLSAIAIHSTAALSLDDPGTTRNALTVIRENSVEGLAEMRRLIGILRDSSGDLEPTAAPTLDGLGSLVENARTNGLDVRLDDTRSPGEAPLPAPVGLAAYRIVQESLTNALKHASPGRVTVTLTRRPTALCVSVTSPYGDSRGPRAPGSGAGLVGMEERAALLGGTFASGPEPHPDLPGTKVWRVEAQLPVDPKDQGAPE
ncbi:sensor histidine kinase [Streptomyces aureocirculatus]|uniref:sensor histidine kinase n=1 Tax=Streptomyces aureocirculatus TaxID=67275 RepID=UPI0004C6B20A|nr:histidine kinase [Streptomyces aureocirculatus]